MQHTVRLKTSVSQLCRMMFDYKEKPISNLASDRGLKAYGKTLQLYKSLIRGNSASQGFRKIKKFKMCLFFTWWYSLLTWQKKKNNSFGSKLWEKNSNSSPLSSINQGIVQFSLAGVYYKHMAYMRDEDFFLILDFIPMSKASLIQGWREKMQPTGRTIPCSSNYLYLFYV